ncbi:MAG: AAA family ATPase [Bacteroidota bacterium]
MNKSLPQGAAALLITLNTPAPNGLTGIPVLLWGRPGVGKSSFIEGLATERTKVLTLIASIHDPTDFSGLPVHENGKVQYVPPAWIDTFAQYEEGILFLDELSTCPPAVQAALLRVVFERRVGFEPLPENVRIVAAANPPDLMVGGWELSPPMRNRFVHLDWDIAPELFTNALLSQWEPGELTAIDPAAHAEVLPEWKAKVAAFLRVSPSLLHGDPGKEKYGYASPRSWEYAAHLLASCTVLELPPNLDLLKGCLGEGTAVALAEYLQTLSMPDPEAVLRGEVQPQLSELNDGEVFVLFAGMERILLLPKFDDHFVSYGKRFLQLTQAVTDGGRRDIIFVSLRRLAKAGFLTKMLTKAQLEQPAEYTKVMQQITTLFSDEGLVEFIDVLT